MLHLFEAVDRAMGGHGGMQARGADANVLQRGKPRPVAQFFRIVDGSHKAFGGADNSVGRENYEP